jgi:hypothetical protein
MEIMELMKLLFAKKAMDGFIALIVSFVFILFILCREWMRRVRRKNGQIHSKSYGKTDK